MRVIFPNVFVQAVLVADVRAIHPMQHQVHAGNAQHSGIEVEAPEHIFVDVLAIVL
ncbi:hypothetical protein D3C76_1731210 [compost metagenome]